MGGFMGFGQSGQERQSNQNLNNVFNYGLDTSKEQLSRGSKSMDDAGRSYDAAADFFKGLISGGRTDTALRSAPAINAAKAQTDTAKREAAEMGTGRTGGDTAVNAEVNQNTAASIDDMLNQMLFGGQMAGASGLMSTGAGKASAGKAGLDTATNFLGLGEKASGDTLGAAVAKGNAQTEAFSRLFSALI